MITALVLCMLAPADVSAGPTSFPVEPLPRVEALRRVSDDVLVVATEGGVYLLERGAAAPRRVAPAASGELVDARELGGALELVATGRYHGPIVRARIGEGADESGGGWRVERPEDVDFVDVALAADGSAVALEREQDRIWAWTGPDAAPRVIESGDVTMMLTDAAGRPWFATGEGTLLREDGGRLVEHTPALPGLAKGEHGSHALSHAWWSPGTGLVWMVTSAPEAVARRLDGTVVTRHPIPEAPEFLDGDTGEHGDVLAIVTRGDDLLLIGEGRVHEQEIDGMFLDGLVLDLEDRAVYLASPDRVQRISIAEAFEPRERRGRAAGSIRGRRARRPGPNMMWLPWLAVPMGPRWDLVPHDRVRYRLDVEVGAIGALRKPAKGLMLLPTVGYGLERGRPTDHLLVVGMGLGWFDPIGGVAARPRLVYGGGRDRTVLGVRSGVIGFVLGGLLSLEVNHQVTWSDGQPRHAMGLEVGVNVLMLLLGAGFAAL